MEFDYLVVGAGLSGAVVARELTDSGKRVLVVEKRSNIAGQCYTENRDGITIGIHGGHIYHTDDAGLWEYANRFSVFSQYSHHVKVRIGDTVFSFPPNLMTYQQLNTDSPDVVRETFFRGYTEKMWGKIMADVPASVLKRIPMRKTWDDHYFSDKFQGLPENGYTEWIGNILSGIEVKLRVDYIKDRSELSSLAPVVIYTGQIDHLFGYDLGRLEYRGLRFEHRREEVEIYQGCPTMNYPDKSVVWLREEEWKFWWKSENTLPYTWVTRSYPDSLEPLYPVNDYKNDRLYGEYRERAQAMGVVLLGRSGTYRYLDMAPAIAAALLLARNLLGKSA